MRERFETHVQGLPSAPRWLTIFIPLIVYPVIAASAFVHVPFYQFWQRKEGGIEFAAVFVLLFGIIHGVVLLAKYRNRLPHKALAYWFGLSTFGMIVFAGEELSWGQHLGLWTSEQVPEVLRAINDQGESNLHNISNAFDQGPTNAIVIGTLVAFVLLPIYLWRRRETMGLDNPGYWFWPTRAGLLAALGVLIIPFPKRVYEWITGEEASSLLRHSEIHEFYIALLMTIYMVDACVRARAAPVAQRCLRPAPA